MNGKLENLQSNIENLIRIFLVLLMGLLLAAVLLQVMMRYLHIPVRAPWTEEVARFLNVWITFIGGAYLLGDYICVNFVVKRMPPKAQEYASIIGNLVSCLFFGIVLWGATSLLIRKAHLVAPTSQISMAFFYLPLVICSLVLLIYHGILAVKGEKRQGGVKE